jgi:uncharacterized protein (DUF608 family)
MRKYMLKFVFIVVATLLLSSCTFTDPGSQDGHEFNGKYTGDYLNRIAFPIGGIGAGMVCLEGTGAVSHVSVYNKPDVFNEPSMFAAISLKGIENGAKVLEGPVPDWKVFGGPMDGVGGPAHFGLPRFDHAEFDARFPFGVVKLKDDDIPLEISITGWSPFIPLDEDNSSLPCGALEYKFVNNGNSEVEAHFSYNTENFMKQPGCKNSIRPFSNGFILKNEGTEESPELQGDFAIYTTDNETMVDHCWFRGWWYDPGSITWKHIEEGIPRVIDPVDANAPGASLFVPFKLKPGEEKVVRLMLSWYAPNSTLRFGDELDDNNEQCDSSTGCCPSPNYTPWYSNRFKSINDVASYWLSSYNDLKKRSELFKETFYNSTLPDEVIEAVAANLTILKSPSVLRQYDGKLWIWEGCNDERGCCFGSCTHVLNYAQSIPHLFPALERTLREAEYIQTQSEAGHQMFRVSLPIRDSGHGFRSAADGQLGGIMKAYRDWRISGDDEWMKKMYPLVRQSLEYCIKEWDPRETGTLEEPHHNTYNVQVWGPDGMCASFYLGALKAMILMGQHLGDDMTRYESLLDKGVKIIEGKLYDGEFFIQEVLVDGLDSPDPVEVSKDLIPPGNWYTVYNREGYSDEAIALYEKEGPKYQNGSGCLSDGILGMWIAKVCGIDDTIVDGNKVKSHLSSVYKYNFKEDLSDHANPMRATYAIKNEAGLVLGTWPKGGKPSLPFVYNTEVWTGIEYQVASHLMFFGMNKEALDIVKACRERYDGRVRNPFNEIECGHWYVRAMSSYGMLQGLTGIRYDAVSKTLNIDSQIGDDFTSFFSCHTGFGNVGLEKGIPFVKMASGSLDVKQCIISGKEFPFTDDNFMQASTSIL